MAFLYRWTSELLQLTVSLALMLACLQLSQQAGSLFHLSSSDHHGDHESIHLVSPNNGVTIVTDEEDLSASSGLGFSGLLGTSGASGGGLLEELTTDLHPLYLGEGMQKETRTSRLLQLLSREDGHSITLHLSHANSLQIIDHAHGQHTKIYLINPILLDDVDSEGEVRVACREITKYDLYQDIHLQQGESYYLIALRGREGQMLDMDQINWHWLWEVMEIAQQNPQSSDRILGNALGGSILYVVKLGSVNHRPISKKLSSPDWSSLDNY